MMKRRSFIAALAAAASGLDTLHAWEDTTALGIPAGNVSPRIWPSRPPKDSTLTSSSAIKGIGFTGRHASYGAADTWYPSWASDDNLYSPFTDGIFDGMKSYSSGPNASTGHAKIVGNDPQKLKITPLGVYAASPEPYGGRYPSANLVHNGIWYYGTYCLDWLNPHLNYDIQGPFVGFRISKDYGKTWIDTACTPAKPLFPETTKNGGKIKLDAPHVVDFGKNMEHSPDDRAYLVGHGGVRPEAQVSWNSGDQIYLARVAPTPENINDLSKYEFFAGHGIDSKPRWSSKFAEIHPPLEWNDRTGVVTITYNAPLKKYLMLITDGFPTIFYMNTYLMESDQITGPWRLVTFMERFGEQGYFVNIPSKFIGADGLTAWLCYSANYTNTGDLHTEWKSDPPGGSYSLSLQENQAFGVGAFENPRRDFENLQPLPPGICLQ